MNSVLLACLLFGPGDAPEVAVAQVKVAAQKVEVTVASLRMNGFGWIDKSAVIIDNDGYCWIKRAAEVHDTPTGIQINRTEKGYGLLVTGRPKWKMTDRSTLQANDVVPCMSWEDVPLSLRQPEEPDIEPKFKVEQKKKPKGF